MAKKTNSRYVIILFNERADRADKVEEVRMSNSSVGVLKDNLMDEIDDSPKILNFLLLTKKEAQKLHKLLSEVVE